MGLFSSLSVCITLVPMLLANSMERKVRLLDDATRLASKEI